MSSGSVAKKLPFSKFSRQVRSFRVQHATPLINGEFIVLRRGFNGLHSKDNFCVVPNGQDCRNGLGAKHVWVLVGRVDENLP